MTVQLKDHLEKRTKECRKERRSMEIWLGALTPANFILVGLAGVLSLIAGAAILTETGMITVKQAGILALISSAATALHSRLRCEAHQAEIRRLRGAYFDLETRFDSLSLQEGADSLKTKIADLDKELGYLRSTATESPMQWAVNKAQREVF